MLDFKYEDILKDDDLYLEVIQHIDKNSLRLSITNEAEVIADFCENDDEDDDDNKIIVFWTIFKKDGEKYTITKKKDLKYPRYVSHATT